MSYTPMAVYSNRINSVDKSKKDAPKGLGEWKEDTNAVASQPESPLKETIDTGDDKSCPAPKVLAEVKGSQHIFLI